MFLVQNLMAHFLSYKTMGRRKYFVKYFSFTKVRLYIAIYQYYTETKVVFKHYYSIYLNSNNVCIIFTFH